MDDCSLGPREREERGGEFRAVAAASLLSREREGQRVRLGYRPSPEAEEALRDLIARERECCPFLEFDLRDRAGELTLEIAAPESASAVLDAIYEASAPQPA